MKTENVSSTYNFEWEQINIALSSSVAQREWKRNKKKKKTTKNDWIRLVLKLCKLKSGIYSIIYDFNIFLLVLQLKSIVQTARLQFFFLGVVGSGRSPFFFFHFSGSSLI